MIFTRLLALVALALALSLAAPAASAPADAPAETYHYATVDGLRIFYREAGPANGPALVPLHGFPSSSHMFRNLLPLLADKYHVIAPDYPGYGYSQAPPVDQFSYTFDHLADHRPPARPTPGNAIFHLYPGLRLSGWFSSGHQTSGSHSGHRLAER